MTDLVHAFKKCINAIALTDDHTHEENKSTNPYRVLYDMNAGVKECPLHMTIKGGSSTDQWVHFTPALNS